MENQNTEGQNMTQQEGTQQGAGAGQQQEKLFTQEEVNRIVGERLARVKNQPDNSGYAEREHELNQREMRLDARERLADAGIPKELLPLVNCSSKEDMENSIKLITAHFGASNRPANSYRMKVSGGAFGNTGASTSKITNEDEIRAAMGLNRR